MAATSASPWEVGARLEHLDGECFVHELDPFARMLGSEVDRGMPDDIARADLLVVLRPWLRRRMATCRREFPRLQVPALEAAFLGAARSACSRMAWDHAEDLLPMLVDELPAFGTLPASATVAGPLVPLAGAAPSPELAMEQLLAALTSLAEVGRVLEAAVESLTRASVVADAHSVN